MSEFIRLEIDLKRCVGMRECGKCVQLCPVNILRLREISLSWSQRAKMSVFSAISA
jgi:ferredoxin